MSDRMHTARPVQTPRGRSVIGATYLGDGKCDLLVWAPAAERVEVVVGDPPSRTAELTPGQRGYHRAALDDVASGTRYRYRLDGVEPLADPASMRQPDGVHGASALVDTAFDWTDDEWTGVRLRDLVLYELHVGAFTPEGTLDAAIDRLSALADLGITAVELMPVNPFPGERNWGYDGVFPFAVHEPYGGPAALQRFVDAAHAAGVGVILDVVYNHLGPEGNVLGRYGPYFTDRYRTPWGDALNFDGAGSDEVRRYFVESALQWIRDFHVDGLRLDAVHAIRDHSARPFLQELGYAVHMEGDRLGRRVLAIPESDANDPRLVQRMDEGGLGLDAVWNDDFHHALHAILTGERQGYYQDFGSIECLEWAYEEGYVYAGQRSEYRGRRHGRSSLTVPGKRFVVCAQNHDQVGNRAGSERLSTLVDLESLKLAAAATIFSPFTPLLFMGEEWGETAPFPYFTDHSDPGLGEAVRTGRQAEFGAFDWEGEIPDPQAESTFEAARIDWSARESGRGAALRDFYREALRLRGEIRALKHHNKDAVWVRSSVEDRLLVLGRRDPGSEAAIVLHFGEEPAGWAVHLPEGTWRRALDTAEERWEGPGSGIPESIDSDGADPGIELELGARSAVVWVRD